MRKIKTIKLQGPMIGTDDEVGHPTCYKVIQVTDSLEFSPGSILTRRQADELCESNGWKVTIVQ